MSRWCWKLIFQGKSWCGNVKVVLKIDFKQKVNVAMSRWSWFFIFQSKVVVAMSRWSWFLTFHAKSWCGNVKVVMNSDFSIKKLMWQCQDGADFLFFMEKVDVAMSRWWWFLIFQGKRWCGNVKVLLKIDFSGKKFDVAMSRWCNRKVDVTMSRWCWFLTFQSKS